MTIVRTLVTQIATRYHACEQALNTTSMPCSIGRAIWYRHPPSLSGMEPGEGQPSAESELSVTGNMRYACAASSGRR